MLVTSLAAGGSGEAGVLPEPGPGPARTWEPAYSRQFPGCVATVLWPREETPTAVVVRDASGEVARLRVERARQAVREGTGRHRVIGVCRERPR